MTTKTNSAPDIKSAKKIARITASAASILTAMPANCQRGPIPSERRHQLIPGKGLLYFFLPGTLPKSSEADP